MFKFPVLGWELGKDSGIFDSWEVMDSSVVT